MSGVRHAVVLGALTVVLAVAALLCATTVVDLTVHYTQMWQDGTDFGPADFDRINSLQLMATTLSAFTPWLVFAAAIAGVGAVLLATRAPARRAVVARAPAEV